MEYYSAIKKDEIRPFAATWMELERVILSEVSQTEEEKYCMTSLYMWHLQRNDTNELSYKTERDSQTSRTSLWLLGKAWGEAIVRECGMGMYTLLYLKWKTNKDLLLLFSH